MATKNFFSDNDEDDIQNFMEEEAAQHEPQYNFLTAKEVSEKFFGNKVTYKKILDMTRKGILPANKVCKNYIYLETAIKEWADANFYTPAWAKKQKKSS